MSPLVQDASVAVDWLLEDELAAAAVLDWLRRDGAVVPQLWQYEVRNAGAWWRSVGGGCPRVGPPSVWTP